MASNWVSVLAEMFAIIFCVYFLILEGSTEKVPYMNVERPLVDSFDRQYLTNVTATSRRYNRTDLHYYLTIEMLLRRFGVNCSHSFIFYELMSVTHKRLVVELQYELCDWIENDQLFGAILRDSYYKIPKAERPTPDFKCPINPGRYIFKNIVIPMVKLPFMFSVQNGRVCYNIICQNKYIMKAHADFQIVHMNVKKAKF